jgi:hypothetical protein
MFHLPALSAIPLYAKIAGGAAALFGGYEVYKHYSKNHILTHRGVQSGHAYVLTIRLVGDKAPLETDAHEILQKLGLHAFSLKQDPKDPNAFSVVASYKGIVDGKHLAKAILPTGAPVSTRRGIFKLALPVDPVSYKVAAATPDGQAAVAIAPRPTGAAPAKDAASGFWRHPIRGTSYGHGPYAYNHPHWGHHYWRNRAGL